jgi:hypothetical protein
LRNAITFHGSDGASCERVLLGITTITSSYSLRLFSRKVNVQLQESHYICDNKEAQSKVLGKGTELLGNQRESGNLNNTKKSYYYYFYFSKYPIIPNNIRIRHDIQPIISSATSCASQLRFLKNKISRFKSTDRRSTTTNVFRFCCISSMITTCHRFSIIIYCVA